MKRLLLIICAAALSMVRCSTTEAIDLSASGDSAIVVALEAGNLTSHEIEESNKAGLFFGEDYKNVQYTIAADGSMAPVESSDYIYYTSAAQQSYCAYYPYNEALIEYKITLDFTAQESLVASVPMHAHGNSSTSRVTLDFGNIYSTLSLYILRESDETIYNDLSCTVKNVTTWSTFDIATGIFSDSKQGDLVIYPNIAETEADATIIVPSCDDLSSIKLLFESESNNYSYSFYPVSKDSEWVADQTYSYGITLPTSPTVLESISIPSTLILMESESEYIAVTFTPSDATSKDVVWSSSNTTVASVSSAGLVFGVGAGSATITAKSIEGGYTSQCEVTVNSYIYVESIVVTPSNQTIKINESMQLLATVSPTTAPTQGVTWKSSNTECATVSDTGLVSGVATGEVTITATATDGSGVYGTTTVTVSSDTAAFIAVGDFLYTDKSYSTEYDADKTLAGIVYLVNSDKKSGKILYMTDLGQTPWMDAGTENVVTGASSETDALSNTRIVQALDATFSEYVAFRLVDELNTAFGFDTNGYAASSTWVWYLPAEDELEDMMYVIFDNDHTNANSYINQQISAAGGDESVDWIIAGARDYVSSTEPSYATSKYRYVRYKNDGSYVTTANGGDKHTSSKYLRPVMAFDL